MVGISVEKESEAPVHLFLSVNYQVDAKEDEEGSYRCATEDLEISPGQE